MKKLTLTLLVTLTVSTGCAWLHKEARDVDAAVVDCTSSGPKDTATLAWCVVLDTVGKLFDAPVAMGGQPAPDVAAALRSSFHDVAKAKFGGATFHTAHGDF